MGVKLANINETYEDTLASVYSTYLYEGLGRTDDIVHVECDLGLSLFKFDMMNFLENYPTRLINVGIAEANAIGFAAGLSQEGFVSYVHSFGPFMSRRVMDQVFISGAYSKANVKILGTDPGVSAAFNGGTHMPFEDIAVMRAIPEIKIVEITDNVAAKALFPQIEKDYGMYYVRMVRSNVQKVYAEGTTFEIGKGNVLQDGTDVTIIAYGIMVAEALQAAKLLEEQGISARVVDMFTIRPLDRDLVIKSAKETGAIVTAENHSVNGGLGDAVTQVVMEEHLCPVERVAVLERFGQTGEMSFLKEEYGLTAENIVNAAKKAISKKQ
jgi:transketolase